MSSGQTHKGHDPPCQHAPKPKHRFQSSFHMFLLPYFNAANHNLDDSPACASVIPRIAVPIKLPKLAKKEKWRRATEFLFEPVSKPHVQ